eukprot:6202575-Pleurochrysis_carterae.AAC.1
MTIDCATCLLQGSWRAEGEGATPSAFYESRDDDQAGQRRLAHGLQPKPLSIGRTSPEPRSSPCRPCIADVGDCECRFEQIEPVRTGPQASVQPGIDEARRAVSATSACILKVRGASDPAADSRTVDDDRFHQCTMNLTNEPERFGGYCTDLSYESGRVQVATINPQRTSFFTQKSAHQVTCSSKALFPSDLSTKLNDET